MTLFGVDKRAVSKRVVSADVPPERKPERGYVRQNHPFTKPPFYLPVILYYEAQNDYTNDLRTIIVQQMCVFFKGARQGGRTLTLGQGTARQ